MDMAAHRVRWCSRLTLTIKSPVWVLKYLPAAPAADRGVSADMRLAHGHRRHSPCMVWSTHAEPKSPKQNETDS